VIACVVEYVIDPAQIDVFERFARRWMELVEHCHKVSGFAGRLPAMTAEPPTPIGGVIALRQYTLRPGTRDAFVALFDAELAEPQKADGIRVLGQFRDLDRPDMFVWLRDFPDMEARRRALHGFYDGRCGRRTATRPTA
jgi:hypothetical protein